MNTRLIICIGLLGLVAVGCSKRHSTDDLTRTNSTEASQDSAVSQSESEARTTKPSGLLKQDDIEFKIVDGWAVWDAKFNRLSLYMSSTRVTDSEFSEMREQDSKALFPKLTPPEGKTWYPFGKLYMDFPDEKIDLSAITQLSFYFNHLAKQGNNVAAIRRPDTDPALFISSLETFEHDEQTFVRLKTNSDNPDLQEGLSTRHSCQWSVEGDFLLFKVE